MSIFCNLKNVTKGIDYGVGPYGLEQVNVKNSINENNAVSLFNSRFRNDAGLNSGNFVINDNIQIRAQEDYPIHRLINYYKFENDYTDDFGVLNGSVVAGSAGLSFGTGLINSGLMSSGMSQVSITLCSGNGLLFHSGTSFSLSAWVNWDGTYITSGVGNSYGIMGRAFNYAIHLTSGTRLIPQFGVRRYGTATQQAVTGSSIGANEWYNIVGVYNAEQFYNYIYLNGSLISSGNTSLVGFTASGNFTIGKNAIIGGNNFMGIGLTKDELGIWNIALSPFDVQNLYTSTGSYLRQPNKIFEGIVDNINYASIANHEFVNIGGRDYSARMMDATVPVEVYTNTEVGSIVRDIMSKYVADITTSNVGSTLTTLNRISFNQTNCYDAIKQLAELADYDFWVDSNKDLNLKPKQQTSSGYTFDNTNTLKADFKTSERDMANEVYVYGDRMLTGYRNDFTADGTGSVYTLDYKPHNTYITLNGTKQVGGIFQMATTAGSANYLVSYDDRQIVFIGVPANNDAIVVQYDRLTPIVKYITDETSKFLYGKKVKVIVDANIKDPRTATNVARSQLSLYATPQVEGNIDAIGVFPAIAGQTAVVNFPNQNQMNKTYSMMEVNYNFDANSLFKEKILKLKLNRKVTDAIDSLKEIILSIKKLQAAGVGTADILTRLQDANHGMFMKVNNWTINTRNISGLIGIYDVSKEDYVTMPGHVYSGAGYNYKVYANSYADLPSFSFLTSGSE